MFLRTSQSLSLLLLAFVFASCSGKHTPAYNPEVGPFDEDGNYIEAWADNPPKTKRWSSSSSTKPKPTPIPAPVVVSRPRPTIVSPPEPTPRPVVRPAAKPKPVVKPKPKPKPAPVKVVPKLKVYTVAKGDTLYGLSRTYGVTVRSIQQANGLSGSSIRIGQSLKIPAK